MLSSREVAKSAKSLICLLQSQVGKQVQIELRNDTYILGTLSSVDSVMNTELIDAHIWSIFAQLQNRPETADSNVPIEIDTEPNAEFLLAQPHIDYLFIKGCRIRYFHLPKEVDLIDSIEQQIAIFRSRKQATPRAFNWKSYRKRQKFEESQPDITGQREGEQNVPREMSYSQEPTPGPSSQ